MSVEKFKNFLTRQVKTITIEPMMLLYSIGLSVLFGSAVSTNLLIWKVCHLELNYAQEICENLSNDNNTAIQIEVQAYVNNFEIYGRWLSQAPAVIFSIIAGALSDVFGRKPLLLIPLVGKILKQIFSIINYTFIRQLPIEFFYFEQVDGVFGGYAVFYLGVYSFGTNVTTEKERAHRLARLDGVETLSFVIGGFLSPYIFNWMGNYGSYCTSLVLFSLAFIHVVVCVNEPLLKKDESSEPRNCTFGGFFKGALVTPLVDMAKFLMRKRTTVLKFIIGLQFSVLCLYWVGFEIKNLTYLFLQLKFDITPMEFSRLNVVKHLTNSFFLLTVVPIMNAKLHLHDALMLFIILCQEGITSILTSFTTAMWQFYILEIIGAIGYCKFSIVRSLMSKCINPNEVGRAFSIFAILGALCPVPASPIFRKLYNATASFYPGAVYALSGSMYIIAGLFNLLIYLMRKHIVVVPDEKHIKDTDGTQLEDMTEK